MFVNSVLIFRRGEGGKTQIKDQGNISKVHMHSIQYHVICVPRTCFHAYVYYSNSIYAYAYVHS